MAEKEYCDMKERFIENGIEYIKCGDYYLLNLTVPSEQHQIGSFGKRHESYIKANHKAYYTTLFMTGKLFEYLAEVDKQAQAEYDILIPALAKSQGITEQLKATDQMRWVGLMNNVKAQAMEIINENYIYTRGVF